MMIAYETVKGVTPGNLLIVTTLDLLESKYYERN